MFEGDWHWLTVVSRRTSKYATRLMLCGLQNIFNSQSAQCLKVAFGCVLFLRLLGLTNLSRLLHRT